MRCMKKCKSKLLFIPFGKAEKKCEKKECNNIQLFYHIIQYHNNAVAHIQLQQTCYRMTVTLSARVIEAACAVKLRSVIVVALD